MKVAIYGGAFDPPTIGHRMVVEILLKEPFEQIWIIPSKSGWRKNFILTGDQRLELLRIMHKTGLNNDIKIIVSDFEIMQPQPYIGSYKLMSLLKSAYPNNNFTFVCGQDVFADIPRWIDGDLLLASTPIFTISRLSILNHDISSTVVRDQLQNKLLPSEYLDSSILAEIKGKGFYNYE